MDVKPNGMREWIFFILVIMTAMVGTIVICDAIMNLMWWLFKP